MHFKAIEQKINNDTASPDDIQEVLAALDAGILRVAEPVKEGWKVNSWVRKAIMRYFGLCKINEMSLGELYFRDKIPLKKDFGNVRIVPGGNAVRYGSYLGDQVIMMPPSYVNIGAYVGTGSMIDSNVLVGSCAQVGERVHLSAGVQIGGVLEPAHARPVIVENGAFIGAGAIIVEGILVGRQAVIAPGVILSAGTRILETDQDGRVIREHIGEIPPEAIVVPGARTRGEVMVQTPIIIGYRNQRTNQKIELTDFLRSF